GSRLGTPRNFVTSLPERPCPGRIALVGKDVKVRNIKFKPREPWDFRHGPVWDKYQKVKLGMTRKDVKAILGAPSSESAFQGRPHLEWQETKQSISVWFDDAMGRAAQKSFSPGFDHVHVYPDEKESP